jgi:hypothetical protein
MNMAYSAIYSDQHGSEKTTIYNDSQTDNPPHFWVKRTLRMRVRGVEFMGTTFCDFEPIEGTDASALATFDLYRNELYGCTIECDIPTPMMASGRPAEATLHVRVILGLPDPRGGRDRDEIRLTLRYNEREYCGSGESDWFEDELLEIQKALLDGVYMKACINCAFSDYNPGGHSEFGDMACYRNNKEDYINSTDLFLRIRPTESVQETYLCPEFQRRQLGKGYRG